MIAAGSAVAGEYEVCVDVTADVRALGSDDAFGWEPARDRLSALGPAAFPALLRALEHERPAVREAIVGVFADAPQTDDAVRRGVARAARNDPEAGVRAVAVPALRRIAGADSHDVVVAAGAESMSNVPYLLDKARFGHKMGHQQLIDAMYRDGLFCPLSEMIMGETVEALAGEFSISRAEQDAYALESQRRCAAVWGTRATPTPLDTSLTMASSSSASHTSFSVKCMLRRKRST